MYLMKEKQGGPIPTTLCNFTLKSSADILGENNARHLLKSVQNHEILINSISINSPLFYKHFLYRKKVIFEIGAENFKAKL